MIEWIMGFLGKTVGIDVAMVLMIVYGMNIALSGIQAALEFVKDKTATQADNKAYEIVGKIMKVLLKIIDMVGYNPKHK